MSERVLFGVTWAVSAAALLIVGFAAVVAASASIAIARAAPGAAAGLSGAFTLYAGVVLLKGLLPALALALLLWALLAGVAQLRDRRGIALAGALLFAATLGSVAAAGLLMPVPIRRLGAVHFTGAGNFARTCVEMALPVALAAWLTRVALPRSRRGLALVLAGIALGLVGVSAAWPRLAQLAAPPPAPSAPSAAEPSTPAPGEPPTAAPAPAPRPHSIPNPAQIAEGGFAPEPAPGWEEIERRHRMAERLRKLIDAGKNATGPAQLGGLLAEGEPVPVYRDGALTGIELHNVPPDGFYARIGLRAGDIVSSINGVPFDSPDAASNLLAAIFDAPQIHVSITRSDGQVQNLAVPRERVLEGLRALE